MKQVIIVNHALKLPKGKLAAQVAHAALAAYLEADLEVQQAYLLDGMPKVVLKADNEAHMLEFYDAAQARGLPAALIFDAGRTVLPEGTLTCVGLGPALDEALDEITGGLSLL